MRSTVDVVVPFRGDAAQLQAVRARLGGLALRDGDTLTVVENDGPTSYAARNDGAERGRAPWIVFLDADVDPSPGLLDAYFEPGPGDRVAILAGGIVDQAAGPGDPPALRYAALRRSMSHETVLADERFRFAQTANCAVRRAAFEAVGGFVATARSGADADLAFRLREAGWQLETRPAASVVHLNRPTIAALLRQRARHGSGAAWLAARHPGALPARGKLGLVRWSLTRWARAATTRDPDERLEAALDPLAVWAFELGRLVPNQRR
jgi:mycofactocin glycosyltransferase